MKTLELFLEGKGFSMEEFNAKSAEEQVGLIQELNNENAEAYKELKEKSDANAEEIERLANDFMQKQEDNVNRVNEILVNNSYALKTLVDAKKGDAKAVKTIGDALAEKADELLAMKGSRTHSGFTFKAPADMLISTNVSGGDVPQAQRLPGLNEIASREIRIFDLVTVASTTSNKIEWVYQANKDGSAGPTAEGSLKNQIDFDIVVASESVKKFTAFIKISEEMLGDIDFMSNAVNAELLRELLKVVETQIYSGDGTGNNLNGIKTVSTAFAAGSFAGTVDNANKVDVLRAAVNQILIADQPAPNAILMHPSDLTSLLFEKVDSTDKRYIMALQEIASNRTLDGIPIVTTTLVTVDDYLVGSFDMATVYQKGAPSIEVGRDSDDFTKNLVTILIEWRGAVVVKNNDRTAFVEGDFTTDAAALETP